MSKLKAKKEMSELSCTREQINLTDICRIFHPINVKNIFLPSFQKTFYKEDHVLGNNQGFSDTEELK